MKGIFGSERTSLISPSCSLFRSIMAASAPRDNEHPRGDESPGRSTFELPEELLHRAGHIEPSGGIHVGERFVEEEQIGVEFRRDEHRGEDRKGTCPQRARAPAIKEARGRGAVVDLHRIAGQKERMGNGRADLPDSARENVQPLRHPQAPMPAGP